MNTTLPLKRIDLNPTAKTHLVKLVLLFLLPLSLLSPYANAQALGPSGKSATSTSHIAVDANGTLYSAYDNQAKGGKLNVKKYDGTNWVSVGAPDFSAGSIREINLVADGNTLYVAYADGAYNNSLTVQKFDGTKWVVVGTPGFTSNYSSSISFVINNGQPYVAYSDYGNSQKLVVKTFDGSNWSVVGQNGISLANAAYTSMVVYNSALYVSYYEGGDSGNGYVAMFNGTTWVTVGGGSFAHTVYSTSLAVNNNVLYVGCSDYGDGTKASVFYLNGSSWLPLGTAGFTPDMAQSVTLAFNNNTPYVAYQDYHGNFLGRVYSYNGSAWAPVGNPNGFTDELITTPNLVFIGNTPYIGYSDNGTSTAAFVQKFDGTNWAPVLSAPLLTDASLANLKINHGTLSPAFATGTLTGYTATVADSVSTLIVQPTPNAAIVGPITVNGVPLNTPGDTNPFYFTFFGPSGYRTDTTATVNLQTGANVITTNVTAQDGTTTKSYVMTVTRKASSDATLANLLYSGGGAISPAFNSSTTAYTGSVPNTTTATTIVAAVHNPAATVTINGVPGAQGISGTFNLAPGDNLFTIVVNAQDGVTKSTYTLIITRAKSTDATLSNLTFADGSISPTFSPATLAYTASVPQSVASTTIIATKNNAAETVTINGVIAPTGQANNVPLAIGNNLFTVLVTAGDSVTTNTYTLTINRASNNASLKTVSIAGASLTNVAGTADVNYTASVPAGTATAQLSVAAQDANATISVNGGAATIGSASATIALTSNPTVINLLVTSQDGSASHTYSITVNQNGSSNASLSTLSVSTGSILTPVSGSSVAYTTNVPVTTTSLSVTPITQDANASVTVNGATVAHGSASQAIALNNAGNTVINVVVTAQNGTTINNYSITVIKAASNNASLSKLSLSTHSTLTSTGSLTYTTSVSMGTPSLTVKATAQDSTATITVNGQPVASGSNSQSITLTGNPATINVLVTAADGVTTNNYSIAISQNGSSNACLKTLAVNPGSLTVTSKLTYTTSVSGATTSINVIPTLQDSTATIQVNGVSAVSGSVQSVALTANPTIINVKVTAQDGVTTNTYTITVSKAGSSNAALTAIVTGTTLTATTGSGDVNYATEVPFTKTTFNVKAIAQDTTATILLNGAPLASSAISAPIALNVGVNNITILVTAQNGITTKTYTIAVTRDAAPPVNALYAATSADSLQSNAVVVHPAVSPNGDGINDFLLIEGLASHTDNHITILNRGGGLVYEAKGYDNYSKTFNGHSSVNGALQQAGTYLYVLDYTDGNVKKHLTGYIVLKY